MKDEVVERRRRRNRKRKRRRRQDDLYSASTKEKAQRRREGRKRRWKKAEKGFERRKEKRKSRRITRKRTRREMWSILLSGCWLKLAVRRWSTSLSGIASIISAKCSSSCSPDAPINEQFLMHSPGQCTRRTHNIIYVRSYGSFAYSYTYSRMQLRDLCMHLGIHAALCVMYLHATQRVTRACIMCTCL